MTTTGRVPLGSRALPETVIDDLLQQWLAPSALATLRASGWVQHALPVQPETGAREFTVIATGHDQCAVIVGPSAEIHGEPGVRADGERMRATRHDPPVPAVGRAVKEGPARAPRFPAHVLLIDDSLDQLDLYELALSDRYELESAADGETGIRFAATHLPDVVLVDLAMPRMDGWEVCRRLKSDPATATIPLIILTAQDEPELEMKARQAGAVGLLHKPCTVDRLRDRIAAAIRRHAT